MINTYFLNVKSSNVFGTNYLFQIEKYDNSKNLLAYLSRCFS